MIFLHDFEEEDEELTEHEHIDIELLDEYNDQRQPLDDYAIDDLDTIIDDGSIDDNKYKKLSIIGEKKMKKGAIYEDKGSIHGEEGSMPNNKKIIEIESDIKKNQEIETETKLGEK